jgi:hypothetical protein
LLMRLLTAVMPACSKAQEGLDSLSSQDRRGHSIKQ